MIAGFPARFDRTFLFAFEKFHQLSHGSFFNPEAFLAGMIGGAVEVAGPGRMSGRDKTGSIG
jgi:hypothetical protein